MIITLETYNLIDFDLQSYRPMSMAFERIGMFTCVTIDGKMYQIFQKKGTEDFCLINFSYKNFGECEVTKSNFFTEDDLAEFLIFYGK